VAHETKEKNNKITVISRIKSCFKSRGENDELITTLVSLEIAERSEAKKRDAKLQNISKYFKY